MYGGGGGGDKIEKETKLKKSHSFRNLFGVNKKEKPLLILNNNEIVIDDSIEVLFMIHILLLIFL